MRVGGEFVLRLVKLGNEGEGEERSKLTFVLVSGIV